MSDEENEIHTLARVRKEVENDAAEKYAKNIEKAKNLWWLIWGLVATTAAGVAWTTSLTINFNNLQKEVDSRETRFAKIELSIKGIESKVDSYIATTNIALANNTSLTNNLQDGIKDNKEEVKAMRDKVAEMWYMRLRGLTNRDVPPK